VSQTSKNALIFASRLANKWKRILFTDESWMSTENGSLRYVRRFYGEVLSKEYSIKKNRFVDPSKKILVWAAISFDGPEQLVFIEEKENKEFYEGILNTCLPEIKRL
jgi:hypothetical protein